MIEKSQTLQPFERARARGVASNDVSRFEPYTREVFSDGWDIEEEQTLIKTEVTHETPRSIITRNKSPDISFDRSINPYRGCEHGCVYCFARPTHAFLGLSPAMDFETKLVARPNAAEVLKKELSAKSYRPATIAIGTNTDPYQPIEKKYQLMRSVLGVLRDFNHPVTIVTKGALIERDIDLVADLAKDGLARVGVSITTLDAKLSRSLEPRAPSPAKRLAVLRALSDAGIPTRAMIAPVIPGLTDSELEKLVQAAAQSGASACSRIMLRLPLEVGPLFEDWLDRVVPDRAARVMARVREMHDGANYDARWGHRMHGKGHYADMIAHRFKIAMRRAGLSTDLPELDCSKFAVPGRAKQLSLF